MKRDAKSPKARKLRAELERLGHTRVVVWWEPMGPAFEMCGHSGGYFFRSAQEGPVPLGLSFDEAWQALQYHDRVDRALAVADARRTAP